MGDEEAETATAPQRRRVGVAQTNVPAAARGAAQGSRCSPSPARAGRGDR
jgi:hypothetical protein